MAQCQRCGGGSHADASECKRPPEVHRQPMTIPVRFPNGAVIQCSVDEQGYVRMDGVGAEFSIRQLLEGAGCTREAAQRVVDGLYGKVT